MMADDQAGSSSSRPTPAGTPKKNNQKKKASGGNKTPTSMRPPQSPGVVYGASLPIRSATPASREEAAPKEEVVTEPRKPDVAMANPQGQLRLGHIDGMQSLLKKLNGFFLRFDPQFALPGARQSGAIVLEGDKGVGKTMLLERVAATGWGNVFRIDPTDKLTKMQDIFAAAFEQQPSIVTIDRIHEVLSEDRNNRLVVIRFLCSILDKITNAQENDSTTQGPQVVVLVTCLDYLKDVPAELRDPGRLDRCLTMPFPDPACRKAILRHFQMHLSPDSSEETINDVAKLTHAFNGHDLRRLYSEAVVERQMKWYAQGRDDRTEFLEWSDFLEARVLVEPSLMDGINLKPRPVYWSEIHGQEKLVSALKQLVEMTNTPELFKDYFDTSPRGFLLYGPPGCSKTMAAQALATESSLNYFAIKGAELLNQYVGETERAIRELFQRARRASPAVVFLDEIDALAGRRSNFGDKSASSTRGPQMVSALLSEMDGFEPLDNVIVLAATNRPNAIDPALLRPGRFDRYFYVPPPTEDARRAILASRFKGKRVSTDLNLDHLAAETEGYSGAELIGICNNACQMAFDVKGEISTEIVQSAIKSTAKAIDTGMLDYFEKWHPSH